MWLHLYPIMGCDTAISRLITDAHRSMDRFWMGTHSTPTNELVRKTITYQWQTWWHHVEIPSVLCTFDQSMFRSCPISKRLAGRMPNHRIGIGVTGGNRISCCVSTISCRRIYPLSIWILVYTIYCCVCTWFYVYLVQTSGQLPTWTEPHHMGVESWLKGPNTWPLWSLPNAVPVKNRCPSTCGEVVLVDVEEGVPRPPPLPSALGFPMPRVIPFRTWLKLDLCMVQVYVCIYIYVYLYCIMANISSLLPRAPGHAGHYPFMGSMNPTFFLLSPCMVFYDSCQDFCRATHRRNLG